MTRPATLLLAITAAVASVAAPPSDAVYDSYAAGADAAARGNWLDALGRLTATCRALDSCEIDDTDFELLWWPARKSLGEVGARLGLHSVASDAAARMESTLASHPDSSATGDGRRADLCKLQGSTAALLGQYSRADSLLRQALALKPYDYDFSYHVLDELASTAYAARDYRAALGWLDSILRRPRRLPEAEAAGLRREVAGQRAIVLARLGDFERATATADSLLRTATDADRPELTRRMAKILMLEADATGRPAPRAARLYRDYLRMTRKRLDTHLAGLDPAAREQYWMAERPYITDSYRLEGAAPDLLYDMALYAKGILLRTDFSGMRQTHRDVRKALPRGSAAVEYLCYERGGRQRLAAVVQRKDRPTPLFVALPSPDSIASHRLADVRASVADALAVSRDRDLINALYTDSVLRAMVWPPQMMAALDGATDVYFAPDGLLHRLAAEYLAPDSLQPRLHRLTSTRQLCAPRRKPRPGAPMLMAGGVDYTARTDTAAATNDPLAYSLMAATGMGLAPLPGSQAEVDSVAALRRNRSDRVLHADSVSEMAVRDAARTASMMLISTHGYFAEAAATATDLRAPAADVQLSQSCLFLAGAERNMRDAAFDPTLPDGILSARELAATDLSGIDLAVLSACMSGLGYVTPDGVFGLQRGLKAGGAGAIVSSLWEVDDRATSLLMRYLFEGLAEGHAISEAFAAARARLRDTVHELHYPGFTRRLRFDSPYFYDSFILIDAI